MRPDEAAFESFICDHLVAEGGWDAVKVGRAQGEPKDFDALRGLDTAELFAFIGATQGEVWDELKKRLGGDADAAQASFVERLAGEIDKRGHGRRAAPRGGRSRGCRSGWRSSGRRMG